MKTALTAVAAALVALAVWAMTLHPPGARSETMGADVGTASIPAQEAVPSAATAHLPRGELVAGPVAAELDAFLEELSREGFAGSVLVARNGDIWLKKGYGLADREERIAIESETRFEVGGLAKIFTAAAVLQLEANGRLRLDDPVEKYIGELSGERAAATIHHLLTHTAGLVRSDSSIDNSSQEAFLRSVRQATGIGKPGEEYHYSNTGYTALAAIVEQVSGMSFESYLQRHLFAPARMRSTGYAWEEPLLPSSLATGYEGQWAEQQQPVPPTADEWGHRGAGGLATNVGDLYRWILALQGEAMLPAASIERMFRAYIGTEGYGWHVIDRSNLGSLVRRGSGMPAFESSVRWYRDDGLVIIFTINSNIGYRIKVARGIARILAPHLEPR